MSKLKFAISMSLDGYIAGPNQSVKDHLELAEKSSTNGHFH
jgi:hypothetical protein